jgi:2-polyprenyl-3-methyl-5-hydroxy-6-metoxy-1,4-benzoquinol methylase
MKNNNKYIELSHEFWNNEYQNSYSKYLEEEKARYSKIACIIKKNNNCFRLLDLGCGTGIIEEYLSNNVFVEGVDISSSAINLAKRSRRGNYYCEDIATFIPNGMFDVVLFNEVLYYLSEANEVVNKYVAYLNENGYMILSLYHPYQGHRYYNLFENLISDINHWSADIFSKDTVVHNDLRWEIISLKFTKKRDG